MYSESLNSEVFEVIDEIVDESKTSLKLFLRIRDKKTWSKIVLDLLYAQDDEENFSAAVRKEYYLHPETNRPTFCWTILVWGDLEEAAGLILPPLQQSLKVKRQAQKEDSPPPTPVEVRAAVPGRKLSVIQGRSKAAAPGGESRIITSVMLPHRAKNRNAHPQGKTKKLGQRGKGAFVETIGGDGGDPWY